MKIAVILGSVRDVRRGERVAKWLMPQLSKIGGAEFELLDLKDYPLPFYNEPQSPSHLKNGYTDPIANKWAAKIAEADGFIIITPEYNHGPSAVLKNALDYLYKEWNKKPVTFVSYATGIIGGARAVEQLRQICVELQMAPTQAAVHIGKVLDSLDENGELLQGNYNDRLPGVVDQLLWWAKALHDARHETK